MIIKRLVGSALDRSDRFADILIGIGKALANMPLVRLLLLPLQPYYRKIQAQTDTSLKATLIVSTVTSIAGVFLLVFLIVAINLSSLIANFMNLSQQRSTEMVSEVKATSEGFQKKIQNFYSESLQRKGSNLMDKDYIVIKTPFLENSFNTVRNFLLKTLELDDEIISASFFANEKGVVKAWVIANSQYPQGFGGLKIVYDSAKKEWQSDADGKFVRLADPQIERILKTEKKSIELIDYNLVTKEGSTRTIKAYDCSIPVFDGRPDEFSDVKAEGAPIGYLRYVITLEKMQSAVAGEEKVMAAALSKAEKDADLALIKTQNMGLTAKFMSLFILTISGGVALLISIVVTRKIANKVTQPIIDLIKSAQNIASGSYDGHDDKVDLSRKDEIGSLARSFETMRQSVHQKVAESTQTIRSILDEVKKSSQELDKDAANAADTSRLLSKSATAQAATLEQISSSMTEMSNKVKSSAGHALKARELMTATQNDNKVGNEKVEAMSKAIRDISDSSQAISKIIVLIDSLAFQTNLLALNAAIEAARAGEHGRGFSVVANEVKNLANRSAQAAQETNTKIEASLQAVKNGAKVATETVEILDKVKQSIDNMTQVISEISTNADDQAEAIVQIDVSIKNIDRITGETAMRAEDTLNMSESFTRQIAHLNEVVNSSRS